MAGAYQALARRWRPQKFSDFVGQESIVRALRHSLDSGRIHHALLFTGTRGVGKTTLARLVAKCLNCERGVSSSPCGTCNACLSIPAGSFMDLLEVDAASRTRVDETRELLDNVQYAPSSGRYKIYLIDEVHMLSVHSFNALLKTLEEPPEHVKFIFATTDPQKIPPTILSRCLQFQLRRLDPPLIEGRLQQILEAEAVLAEPEALKQLSKAADGSLRDALSLVDQAIVQGGGAVTLEGVHQMLGTGGSEAVWTLVDSLVRMDAEKLFVLLHEQFAVGWEPEAILDAVLGAVHQASLSRWVPRDTLEMPAFADDGLLTVDLLTLQAWHYILLSARRDFHLYPDARMAAEMAFLRVLAFQSPDGPAGAGDRQQEELSRHSRAPQTPPAAKPGPSGRAPVESPPSWEDLLAVLDLPPTLREVLRHTRAGRCDAESLELGVEENYRPYLEDPRAQRSLLAALERHWGQKPAMDLQTLIDGEGPGSLAAEEIRAKRLLQQQAELAVKGDGRVLEYMEQFGARILGIEMEKRETGGSGESRG